MKRTGFALVLLGLASCNSPSKPAVACGVLPSYASVAQVLDNQNCLECFLNNVESALATCPDDKRLLLLAFYGNYRDQKPEMALNYYEKMVSASAATQEEHVNAALMLEERGELEKAERSFKAAVASNQDPAVNFYLARVLSKMQKYGEARAILVDLLPTIRPVREEGGVQELGDDVYFDDAAMLLARIYEEEGLPQKAEEVYGEILKVHPSHEDAQAGLSALENRSSKPNY